MDREDDSQGGGRQLPHCGACRWIMDSSIPPHSGPGERELYSGLFRGFCLRPLLDKGKLKKRSTVLSWCLGVARGSNRQYREYLHRLQCLP
jgi:hypothetical protein